jgi:hypothetical protein
VEWNSARFSRRAVEKARDTYGVSHVGGSLSHLEVDEGEDHYESMVGVAERLTRDARHYELFFEDLTEIAKLFRRYFHELSHFGGVVPGSEKPANGALAVC